MHGARPCTVLEAAGGSPSVITDVVLVHGFWSSPATWDRLALKIESDPELEGVRIHRFGYQSPKFRMPGFPSRIPDYDDIAQVFPSFLEARIPYSGSVAVVTHSQGGLILQRFLAWMLREGRGRDLARIQLAIMLACPNEGSEYLASMRAAAGFSMHPQAKALRVLNIQVSETQRIVLRQIVNADHTDERHCPIPFYVYSGASDNVVRRISAQSIFPQAEALPGDHFSILDPDFPGSLTFDVLKRHLLKTGSSTPVATTRRVKESRSRIELNIHPAIALAGDYSSLSTDFPEYVTRAIDGDLRSWIRSRTQVGGLVLLVGDAAAGKTRCLYEALDAEVPDWRMPYLESGADITRVTQEGADLSGTIFWLDDLQNFFADGSLAAGTVRRLLAGHFGPVLLTATIRTEELDKLLAQPESADEREAAIRHQAREVIRMLAHWPRYRTGQESAVRFEVDNQFGPEELALAGELSAIDPRIREALRQASRGNVTATLAGAPELVARWTARTGNRHGRAIITAAVTARRCGHPEPLPVKILEALAVAQLRAEADTPVAPGWLQAAIGWAERPTEGNIAALRPAATTPGVIEGYKVSDILLQHSYDKSCSITQPLLDDPRVWALLLEHAAAPACTGIGDAAYAEGQANSAERAWQRAAGAKDPRGMRRLGWLCTDQGRQEDARHWFKQAIALDDTSAMLGFAFSLQHFGQFDESLHWMRRAAERDDPDAMISLGFELQGRGQEDEAEIWYRRAASFDHPLAMTNLGYLLHRRHGDTNEAEHWTRKAAALGQPGAMENLALTLKGRGQLSEALEWFRKAADRAVSKIDENPGRYDPWPGEASDQGVSDSILGLAELLSELGEVSEAEQWFHKIAELGDGRAASALADLCLEHDQSSAAAGWRKKAAEFSHELLSRSKRELLGAYGEPGVQRHIHIMQEYAKYLSVQGDSQTAHTWERRASEQLPPSMH